MVISISGVVMKIFAGLSLADLNIEHLTLADCNRTQSALGKACDVAFGKQEYATADEIIHILQKYIKFNMIDPGILPFDYVGKDDMLVALSLYMLPANAQQPLLVKANQAIDGMLTRGGIYYIKALPFRVHQIRNLWGLIEKDCELFNSAGTWHMSALNLYVAVHEELLAQATLHLTTLSNHKVQENTMHPSETALNLAWQIIGYIKIVRYIHQRLNDYDYKANAFLHADATLAGFIQKVIYLLKNALTQLRELPENNNDVITTRQQLQILMYKIKTKVVGNCFAIHKPLEQHLRIYPE